LASALPHAGHWRIFAAMAHASRIDLRIPPRWRKELDELAAEVGLSSTDVARLAIRYLLLNRDRLLKVMDEKE
jgi:hypothetical protein